MLAACGGRSVAEADVSLHGTLGQPTVSPVEMEPKFNGYASVETDSDESCPGCGDNACVVNHFQGRVTCPYGQTQEEIDTLPGDHPLRCRATDVEGQVTTEPVLIPVKPQLIERRPADTVVCSCQCAGREGAAPPEGGWCSCPASMECASLFVDNWAFTRPSIASYCIPRGTAYDPNAEYSLVCDKHGTDPATDCGNNRENP